MKARTKIFRWIIAGLGIVLVMIVLGLFLFSQLVNLDSAKKIMMTKVSEKAGGQLKFASLDFSLLPLPHVIIREGHFSVDERVRVSFEKMSVYPAVLPLLKGMVKLRSVYISSPEIKLSLPARAVGKNGAKKQFSINELYKVFTLGLASFASKAPDLVFEVNDGIMDLISNGETVFWFKDIQARIAMPVDESNIEIKCKSSLGERISLMGSVNLKQFIGDGHVKLYKFQPAALYDYFLPTSAYRISNSIINLDVNFNANNKKHLNARFKGSIPDLSLRQGKSKFPFRATNIEGEVQIADGKTSVALEKINLVNPELSLRGRFLEDSTTKSAELEIRASEVDIKSVREAALFLVGQFPVTQKIFEIIKGGYSPLTEFSSKAKSISALGKEENFTIRGRMQDGNIYIPQADLDLNDASGYALVSKGILEAGNLAASAGNSRGHNGNLKLGLGRKNEIFKLNVLIDGDLSELPPYLSRYIKNGTVRSELSLIRDLRGSAQAHLILGDTKHSIKTKIDARNISLSANYARIPYPIEIKGGQFLFDMNRIDLDKLNLNLDQSRFAGLSGWVDWDQATDLSIQADESDISLKQILPWLSSFKNMGNCIKYLNPFNGSLAFSSIKVEGPLSAPGEWDMQIKGEGNLYDRTGPKLTFDLTNRPQQFAINKLTIDDEVSHAVLKAQKGERFFGINFVGTLNTNTLKKLFSNTYLSSGWIKGDIRAEINVDQPLKSRAGGSLEVENLTSPLIFDESFKINRILLEANKNQLTVKSLNLSLGDTNLAIEGNLTSTKEGFQLLLDASSDLIEWKDMKSALDRFKKGENIANDHKAWHLPLKGTCRLRAENFRYEGFNWNPFDADIKFGPKMINIIISDASLCGIDTPGVVNISPSEKNLDFKLSSSNQKLRKTINCLFKKENIISGDFDFEGTVKADVKNRQFIRSLQGNVHLSARNGRIYHDKFLLEVLDIMRIVNLRLPELANEGLAYKSLDVKGELKNGTLILADSILDSPTMAVLVDGDVDLVDKAVDLKLKVAPIKLVNFATTKIPILRRIRGGHLLSIPVGIKGDWGSPEVKKEEE